VRAAIEAVAYEIQRCLEAMAGACHPLSLAVGGSSATGELWLEILGAVTGLPSTRRRSGEAAMAGAALVAARAMGGQWQLERLDPIDATAHPDDRLVARYRQLRPAADTLAEAALAVAKD
jgi:sugar (pentulose or hexulose) kinase